MAPHGPLSWAAGRGTARGAGGAFNGGSPRRAPPERHTLAPPPKRAVPLALELAVALVVAVAVGAARGASER